MSGLLHPLAAALAGWLLLPPDPAATPATRRTGAERVGLGALLGIALLTLLLALVHLVLRVPLALPAVVVLELLLLLAGVVVARRRRRASAGAPVEAIEAATPSGRWSPIDLLLVLLLAGVVGVAAGRADFYPVSAMDAHGYDGRARWIVAERTLDLSIYTALDVSGRNNLTYPPLQPLASALVYWGGGGAGKVVDIVFFTALLLIVGGVTARRAGRTAGLLAAFLVAGAPEVWRHLSLGLTNIQAMAYVGAAVLLLAEGNDPAAAAPPGRRPSPFRLSLRPRGDDLLPALLLAAAAGTRPEGVVVAPVVALAVRRPLVALPALLIFGGWQFVLATMIDSSNAAALRASWLPDLERLGRTALLLGRHLAEPGLLGWTMPLLALALAVTIVRRAATPRTARGPARATAPPVSRRAAGDPFVTLLLLEAALAIALLLLYQQIAPDFGGGGDSYLYNSLKRATFVLLPGAAVALLLSPPALRLLQPIEIPASRSR